MLPEKADPMDLMTPLDCEDPTVTATMAKTTIRPRTLKNLSPTIHLRCEEPRRRGRRRGYAGQDFADFFFRKKYNAAAPIAAHSNSLLVGGNTV
jgi:hypothetical protein